MKPSRPVFFAVMGACLAAALVIFGLQLRSTQENSRDDLVERFENSAANNAALVRALFGSSTATTSAELAREFGGAAPSSEALEKRNEEAQSPYALVVEANGGILASAGKLPPGTPERVAELPEHVKAALSAQGFGLSDVVKAEGDQALLEFANGFEAEDGSRRALVSAIDPALLTSFLGSYLNETRRLEGGQGYITDSKGAVIAATSDAPAPIESSLLDQALSDGTGDYGNDRHYASAPIEGTNWRVIATAPNDELFSAVSGTSRWIPWVIFIMFALAAAVAFVMSRRALNDADRIREANERLETQNEMLEHRARELQRSNEELEQFASIASHDLSEPLRKVQMFSKQLLESEGDDLSERGADYVGRMIDASERMQALIEDLLEFSRVTTRGRPFTRVDLREIFLSAASDLEVPLSESGGEVEVGDLPVVEADAPQIQQLAQNLVSNAIKFRREGVAPHVQITGEVSGNKARIVVSDNGIGFDPRYAMRIFRVFERLHGRNSYPGTGIGLALCRKIAERHGGGIVAESSPGDGATFTITLPVRQFDAPTANGTAPEDDGARTKANAKELTNAHN